MSLDDFGPLEINSEDYISVKEIFDSKKFPLIFRGLNNSYRKLTDKYEIPNDKYTYYVEGKNNEWSESTKSYNRSILFV